MPKYDPDLALKFLQTLEDHPQYRVWEPAFSEVNKALGLSPPDPSDPWTAFANEIGQNTFRAYSDWMSEAGFLEVRPFGGGMMYRLTYDGVRFLEGISSKGGWDLIKVELAKQGIGATVQEILKFVTG